MSALEKGSEQGREFIQGLAYSVAWLIEAHDEVSIAIDLLTYSGYTYGDLRRAGCDSHDLKPIAKALGLRVDGKPRKNQQ